MSVYHIEKKSGPLRIYADVAKFFYREFYSLMKAPPGLHPIENGFGHMENFSYLYVQNARPVRVTCD